MSKLGVVWGTSLGHSRYKNVENGNSTIRQSTREFLLALSSNYIPILYRF